MHMTVLGTTPKNNDQKVNIKHCQKDNMYFTNQTPSNRHNIEFNTCFMKK